VAAAHPDGLVDLSIGTPVDPVPRLVQDALAAAANAPGYPATAGRPALRASIEGYLRRRCGVAGVPPTGAGPDGPLGGPEAPLGGREAPLGGPEGPGVGDIAVLPTIGSKELVAWLPTLLGLGPSGAVVVPSVCYPTYEVGARLAGAAVIRADATVALGPATNIGLIWVNSPGNPHGRVLPAEHLRKVVDWARERGALVVSDECYLELGWEAQPVSVLDPAVCGGSYDNVLAVHSLSKRSNLAGYRAGFVAGDPAVVDELLAVRKHAGMMVPGPVQAAMAAALDDDEHVGEQRERYRRRRDVLRSALLAAGFRIDHSEAGLYLWATRDEPAASTLDWLAARGILAAPGYFYGPTGERHVRLALTATDERIEAAAGRLMS
jgi:succinyldiaminopimelate transaminase